MLRCRKDERRQAHLPYAAKTLKHGSVDDFTHAVGHSNKPIVAYIVSKDSVLQDVIHGGLISTVLEDREAELNAGLRASQSYRRLKLIAALARRGAWFKLISV